MAVEPVFPGKVWETKSPAEVGLDGGRLKAFSDFCGGRGCVTRYGFMAHTWGDHTKRGDVASACKPWFSHFLFKALEDGRVDTIDAAVVRWQPGLADLNADLGHKDRGITLRHMANQVSCYGVREAPGAAFCYNDWQMALFWDTLFLKIYGATYATVDEKVLHPLLTDAIGCEDRPTLMAFGTKDRPGRVGISPRDFCRFGLLYLRQGRWGERQVLKEEHAVAAVQSALPASLPRSAGKRAAMLSGQRTLGSGTVPDNQCDHRGSYSFAWWTNGVDRGGDRLWPGVPEDAYGAFGHGGPRAMAVIPSLGLVVSWNDAGLRGWDQIGKALRLVVEAVQAPEADAQRTPPATQLKPLAGQIISHPANPAWLVRYDPRGNHKPFFMCGPGDPEDFLYRGKRNPDGTRDGDQAALIEKLKPTGANCIYIQAVRSHGGDGDRTHNPFVDNDPAKGLNQKVLDQWETWFSAMDEAGIMIFLFLYDDSASIWKTGDQVGPDEHAFIESLVNRFKHHRHLIWCVAEEYQERFSAKRVSAIAAAVRAADDHGHPIAVHKLSGLGFSEFADDPNIDQFAIQYNQRSAADLHAGMVKAFGEARGRYNLNMSEAANHGSGAEARRKNWACAMGGAYVMVLGMDIASTPVSDLEDCGRLVRFFGSAAVTGMVPHDELAHGGTQYVLAKPAEAYIAYSANAGQGLGLKGLPAGRYALRWFDCTTGRTVEQRDVAVPAGDRTWDPPAGFGGEVAVSVRVGSERE